MNYLDILESEFFKQTYTEIAELKKDFAVDHAFIHIGNVIENSKRLAKLFNLNKENENLLLIAAALHDVGYLKGREEHAKNGAIVAREFLVENNFGKENIDKICLAIASHGGKEINDYYDEISFCLILADKLDFISNRYHADRLEERHEFYLHIYKTEFVFENDKYYLNVYSDCEISEEKKSNYFFTKLKAVLEFVGKVKNKEVVLNFIVCKNEG